MDPARFEWRRMSLFATHGFVGTSRRIEDRDGRRTYVLVRGEDDCPTVLVHGGMAEASDWALVAGRLPGYVVIPDRPGCGLSYPVDYRGSDYRKAAADWLRDLADGLGCRQDRPGRRVDGRLLRARLRPPAPTRSASAASSSLGAPAGLDRNAAPPHPFHGPSAPRAADRAAEDRRHRGAPGARLSGPPDGRRRPPAARLPADRAGRRRPSRCPDGRLFDAPPRDDARRTAARPLPPRRGDETRRAHAFPGGATSTVSRPRRAAARSPRRCRRPASR